MPGLKSSLLCGCAVALLAGSNAAMAQSEVAQSQDSGQIGDIVVTAQRRSESAQKVPIAITAFTGEMATSMGITSTTSLSGRVPSLSVSNVGPGNIIFMRGVGNDNVAVNAESSTAIYIDGAYIYSANGNILPLFDLDRLEVLKGPQGTLFGRNATAGVVQVITKDPTAKPEFRADLGYANYDTITGHAYANAGLTDSLAFNASVDYRHQGDGWGFNPVRDEEAYYANRLSLRTKLKFTPTDQTTITVGFHYNHNKTSGFEAQVPEGVIGPDGVVGSGDRYEYRGGARTRSDTQTYLGIVKAEQDLGFAKLVSISSYSKLAYKWPVDADYTPAPIVDAVDSIFAHNVSQEFQLQSSSDSSFTWVAGAYYFNAKAGYTPIHLVPNASLPFANLDIYAAQKTESLAGFAQANIGIFEATKLTVGFRYTDEKIQRVDSSIVGDGATVAVGNDQSKRKGTPTWRVALDQQFGPDILGYLSYTRGSKSGGYNITAGPGENPPYEPEKLDAFEAGLKTELFNHHLRFNMAGFVYKYKNIQVNQVNGPSLLVLNAATATVKGVEADFQVRPMRGLTLTGSGGYTDGKFDSYTNAVGFYESGSQGPAFLFNASGNRLPYAAKFSATFDANYTFSTSIGEITLDSNIVHSSRRYVSSDNRLSLRPYTIVNSSIVWASEGSPFSARLWAENMFDKRYFSSALEGANGDFVLPAAPRTYGVTLTVKM